jgi:hypothetical protein
MFMTQNASPYQIYKLKNYIRHSIRIDALAHPPTTAELTVFLMLKLFLVSETRLLTMMEIV